MLIGNRISRVEPNRQRRGYRSDSYFIYHNNKTIIPDKIKCNIVEGDHVEKILHQSYVFNTYKQIEGRQTNHIKDKERLGYWNSKDN